MADPIVHDEARQRFTHDRDGYLSYLAYRRLDEETVDFLTTYTPPPVRGRGIAAHLVRHALEWAEGQGLKIVPSCWFVAEYVEREPSWRRVLSTR